MKRLTALAHELAADGILPDAGKTAHAEMHKVLDAARTRYDSEIVEARSTILEVGGRSGRADLKSRKMTFDDFVETADFAVIDDAYRRSAQAISPDLATSYTEHLAKAVGGTGDPENALIDARIVVAALGRVEGVVTYLEAEAETLATDWLAAHRVAIKALLHERQDVYRTLRSMSTDPVDVGVAKPTKWMQPTVKVGMSGDETPLPRYDSHLLVAKDGKFSEDFNDWEERVLQQELRRKEVVAWYRNPSRPSQDSLGVAYAKVKAPGIMRPDFVFFIEGPGDTIVADIVDPHGIHLSDALPKLQGLAKYAEAYGGSYRRIEAVAKLEDTGTYRVLDLTDAGVRHAIADANSAEALYRGEAAEDYAG